MNTVDRRFWEGLRNAAIPSLILWALIIWGVSALFSDANATKPVPPKAPETSQEQQQDQGQDQTQDQEQGQSQEQSVSLSPSISNRVEYPKVSAVFGMGSVAQSAQTYSNGPCPLWVQDKPSRSFPGHGRGETLVKDESCWELTEKWLQDEQTYRMSLIELEQTRADIERLRLEQWFEEKVGK